MLVGYARVSREGQLLDRQLDALIENGVDKRNIYCEKITGTKFDRPELMKMLDDLQPNDVIIVSELTRLSRSLKDLLDIVEIIHKKDAHIKSLKESWLDTTTPHGMLMFTVSAGLSQFERDIISERTKEGLKAAKARGRSGGRPSKQSKYASSVEAMYKGGVKKADIVRNLGISRSTVDRIVRKIAPLN